MGLVTHVLYDRSVGHLLPTATCPRRPNPSLFLIGVESGIAARSAPLRDQKSLWPIACSSSIKSKQLPQSAPAGNWRYQAIRLVAIVSRGWRPPTRFCVGRSSSPCWQYTSVVTYSHVKRCLRQAVTDNRVDVCRTDFAAGGTTDVGFAAAQPACYP